MNEPDRSEEMLQTVPQYYRGSKHYLAQNNAKGQEFNIMRAIIDDMPNQFNPQTATWGLRFWEEFLEITPTYGEALAVRRLNVLKKSSSIKKVTPISLERMIWNMAQARVSIIRNVARYTFRVYLHEESVDESISAIREVVEEYKEAHMAYNMAVFLGTIHTNEKFLPKVTHRMVMFWYADWILNGRYRMDGQRLLDTVFPPLYRMINRLNVYHNELFNKFTLSHLTSVKNTECFRCLIRNVLSFYWWGDGNHLLNGRYLLDGTYLLSTVFPPYNAISTHRAKLPIVESVKVRTVNNRAAIRNTPKANITSVQKMIIYWWGDLERILNGYRIVDGNANLDMVFPPYFLQITHRWKTSILESICLKMFYTLGEIKNAMRAPVNNLQRVMFCWWGDKAKILNGGYLLGGETQLNKEFPPYETTIANRFKVTHREETEATVTIKNNLWYMDGTYSLDGSNKLNAYELKEEL